MIVSPVCLQNPTPARHYCTLCGNGFASESGLNTHVEKVHETSCHECEQTFPFSSDLNAHILASHGHANEAAKVNVPGSPPAENSQLNELKMIENYVLNKVIEFLIISLTEDTYNDVTDDTPHSGDPEQVFTLNSAPHIPKVAISCDYCAVQLACDSDLETHVMNKHHGELVKQIIHFDEFSFNCDTCIFGCSSKLVLATHMQKKHGSTLPAPIINQPGDKTNNPYTCQLCEVVFVSRECLTDHIDRVHVQSTSIQPEPSVQHPFPCSSCTPCPLLNDTKIVFICLCLFRVK